MEGLGNVERRSARHFPIRSLEYAVQSFDGQALERCWGAGFRQFVVSGWR